jgi:hypothetical protein
MVVSGIILLVGVVPARGQAPAVGNLAFMAGCWNGSARRGTAIIEEHWTAPTANVMLGTTRYIAGDSTLSWEFTLIESGPGGVVMTPHPSGQTPVPFRLVGSASGEAVFENPAHDFPQRITYRRVADTLIARIEADTPERRAREWRLTPARCG